MPTTTSTKEIELIIENTGGGGGGNPPPADRNGGGDGGGGGKKPGKGQPSSRRYFTGMVIGIVSILMFFMALSSAFLVRKGMSGDWVPVRIPTLLWINTGVLLISSGTLEVARKRLARADGAGFNSYWMMTTTLGVAFLIGQAVAWRQLARQGIYLE